MNPQRPPSPKSLFGRPPRLSDLAKLTAALLPTLPTVNIIAPDQAVAAVSSDIQTKKNKEELPKKNEIRDAIEKTELKLKELDTAIKAGDISKTEEHRILKEQLEELLRLFKKLYPQEK
jgi:hypothetical protein